jgi:hypothetical protein
MMDMNLVKIPSATLTAHCGARKVTRNELLEIAVPDATRTHQPLSHFEIVEVLEEALSFRYLKIVRDEYAVSQDGMKLFGVMDLNAEFSGCRFSIGLRNSNDKSMRLALTAGYRVFVCDNMAFSGDFTPLFHKHTKNLELKDSISIAVDRIQRGFEPLKKQVAAMRDQTITDDLVKLIIYEAFMDRSVKGLSKFLMPLIHELYFNPKHEAFAPRTLWSLSNAFTSAFKKLAPTRQFEVTARLGAYLAKKQVELQANRELFLPVQRHKAIGSGGVIENELIEEAHFDADIANAFDEEAFDEDDIAEDDYGDEVFDEYFDREAEDAAIDEAAQMDELMEEQMIEEYEKRIAA